MAISPIGNMVFVNQNMHVASQTQAQQQGKIDFQTALNIQSFQEKEKVIEEVRPLEENQAIDPDKEHEKNKQDQETKRTDFNDEEEEEESKKESTHLLDIKI